MCTDYHYLNDWTIKNAYPLPLIFEIIDKVGKAKVFTKLYLRWGYNNVQIKKGHEWKAAFATRRAQSHFFIVPQKNSMKFNSQWNLGKKMHKCLAASMTS